MSEAVCSHARVRGLRAAVLSTCERFEVYGLVDRCELESLAQTMASCVGPGGSPCDRRMGHAAVEHLFRVASGLESRLLGEPEILGQVDAARSDVLRAIAAESGVRDDSSPRSRESGALLALFTSAVRCGRRARSRTALGALASSSIDLTIDVLSERVRLGDAKIGIVGSGAVAGALASKLCTLGVASPIVLARHAERAERAMRRQAEQALGVRVLPLMCLEETLAMLDALVTATASTTTLVHTAMVGVRTKPLLIVDLGVPANVDDEVGELPGVRVIGLDELTPRRKPLAEAVERASLIASDAARVWSDRWLVAETAGETATSVIGTEVMKSGAEVGMHHA